MRAQTVSNGWVIASLLASAVGCDQGITVLDAQILDAHAVDARVSVDAGADAQLDASTDGRGTTDSSDTHDGGVGDGAFVQADARWIVLEAGPADGGALDPGILEGDLVLQRRMVFGASGTTACVTASVFDLSGRQHNTADYRGTWTMAAVTGGIATLGESRDCSPGALPISLLVPGTGQTQVSFTAGERTLTARIWLESVDGCALSDLVLRDTNLLAPGVRALQSIDFQAATSPVCAGRRSEGRYLVRNMSLGVEGQGVALERVTITLAGPFSASARFVVNAIANGSADIVLRIALPGGQRVVPVQRYQVVSPDPGARTPPIVRVLSESMGSGRPNECEELTATQSIRLASGAYQLVPLLGNPTWPTSGGARVETQDGRPVLCFGDALAQTVAVCEALSTRCSQTLSFVVTREGETPSIRVSDYQDPTNSLGRNGYVFPFDPAVRLETETRSQLLTNDLYQVSSYNNAPWLPAMLMVSVTRVSSGGYHLQPFDPPLATTTTTQVRVSFANLGVDVPLTLAP